MNKNLNNCCIRSCLGIRLIPGPTGPIGPAGPIGPKGDDGDSVSLVIGDVKTVDANENASINDYQEGNTHILSFNIPRGMKGDIGPKGEDGEDGIPGTSVTILGSYDNVDDLKNDHNSGSPGDGYLIGDDLYVWSANENEWKDVGVIRGPKGEKGEKGEKGDNGKDGIEKIPASYIVTFNESYPQDGFPVLESSRIPLKRKDIESDKITVLHPDNLISFNKIGYYRITFTVNAYKKISTPNFVQNTDFIAIGFRKKDTDLIYVGDSKFIYRSEPQEIHAEGIITVEDTNNEYELVNLSQDTIYLITPFINDIDKTRSYFINPTVRLIVEYLGTIN